MGKMLISVEIEPSMIAMKESFIASDIFSSPVPCTDKKNVIVCATSSIAMATAARKMDAVKIFQFKPTPKKQIKPPTCKTIEIQTKKTTRAAPMSWKRIEDRIRFVAAAIYNTL